MKFLKLDVFKKNDYKILISERIVDRIENKETDRNLYLMYILIPTRYVLVLHLKL